MQVLSSTCRDNGYAIELELIIGLPGISNTFRFKGWRSLAAFDKWGPQALIMDEIDLARYLISQPWINGCPRLSNIMG